MLEDGVENRNTSKDPCFTFKQLELCKFCFQSYEKNKIYIFVVFTWISLIKIVLEQTKRGRLIHEPQTWKLSYFLKCYIKTDMANFYRITIVEYRQKSIRNILGESIPTMVNMLETKITKFLYLDYQTFQIKTWITPHIWKIFLM